MANTEDLSNRLLRLPLWVGMDSVENIVTELTGVVKNKTIAQATRVGR
jgi:dTDP-4-amino-4,6-dideoxygalactose transaminase